LRRCKFLIFSSEEKAVCMIPSGDDVRPRSRRICYLHGPRKGQQGNDLLHLSRCTLGNVKHKGSAPSKGITKKNYKPSVEDMQG
jgi:hypothetical protein